MSPVPPHQRAAAQVAKRAASFADRWSAGFGRSLWQKTIVFHDRPTDLTVGWWFACAGGQVIAIGSEAQPYKPDVHDALVRDLLEEIRNNHVGLLTAPLEGLSAHSFRSRWGYTYRHAPRTKWSALLKDEVAEVILVDGLGVFGKSPDRMLRLIHRIAQWSTSIEIRPRDTDTDVSARLEQIRARAIALGFGVAPASDNDSVLSLVRLEAPMSEHPVPGDATIMAHSNARLDLAVQLADDKTILDIGGWQGLGAQRYLDAGARAVTVVDVSKEDLDKGAKRYADEPRVDFKQWDLNRTPWPFDDASFDLLVCLEVLEHLREQPRAIREMRRILKPDGLVLVSVPDRQFEDAWTKINGHDNAYHLHVPSSDDLDSLLTAFSPVHYFTQVDVAGSLVIPESDSSKLKNHGTFEIEHPFDPRAAMPQVRLALAAKSDGSVKKLPATLRSIVSDLHISSGASSRIIELRTQQIEQRVSHQRELFDAWKKHNTLSQDLKSLEATNESLKKQLSASSEIQDRLKATHQKLDELQAASTQATQSAQHRFDELRTTSNEAIEAARADAKAQSDQLAAEMRRSTNVLNETLRQKGELQSQRTALQSRIDELTQRLSKEAKDHALAEQNLARTSEDLKSLQQQTQKEQSESREKIQKLEQQLAQSAADANTLAQRYSQERRNQQAEIERITNLLSRSTTHSEALQKRLDDESARTRSLDSRLAAANATIQSLRSQIDQLQKDKQQQAEQVERERKEWMQHARATLNEALDTLEHRTLTVEEKIYDLEELMNQRASIASQIVNGGRAS